MFFREHTVKGEMSSPLSGKWWPCHSSHQNRLRKHVLIWTEELVQHHYSTQGLHLEAVDPKSSFSCLKLVAVYAFREDQHWPRGVAQPLEYQGLPDRKSAFLPAPHRAVQGGNRYPFDCPTSVWGDDEKRQQKKTNLLCFSFHFNFCKNFWRISYVQKLLILIKFNQVLIRFLCLSVEKFVHTIVFLWAFPSDVYLET